MIASGEFDCSRVTAKSVFERSIPVFFVYSAKAVSMINWMLEVEVSEEVACPVDDMIREKWTCSRSCVQSRRGWYGSERIGV